MSSPISARGKQSQTSAALNSRSELLQPNAPGEQFVHADAQHFCQKNQFSIGHSAQLRLKFSQRPRADAPAEQLEFLSQEWLSPTLPVTKLAHLRANHVQSQRHRGLKLCANRLANYSHMRMKRKVLAFICLLCQKGSRQRKHPAEVRRHRLGMNTTAPKPNGPDWTVRDSSPSHGVCRTRQAS